MGTRYKTLTMASLCLVATLFTAAMPSIASADGSSVTTTTSPSATPLTCGWEVARSAYLQSGGINYGIVDLNYNTCDRYVYGSIGSYISACNTSNGNNGCGQSSTVRSDGTATGTCNIQNGAYGCNTNTSNDAGYTSYADGTLVDYSLPGGSVSANTGWF